MRSPERPWICPKRGWRLRGVGTLGVVCLRLLLILPGSAHRVVNEVSVSQQLARRVAVTSCTIRKASDGRLVRPACEARFWDWKLGPAKAHYLWGPADMREPHI